ncbi:DUF5105 domain-containing protein, partial [Bacillus subtilis]|uniref:DUF5105 domain-containing protein n=1 Tax=Bacillus subtilis TaxID=1423 RepID=UPI003399463E
VDENKREVVTDYLEGAQKCIVRSLGYYDEEDVDKKKLNKLISAIQNSVDNVAASSEELTASALQTSKATEHITMAIEQITKENKE